MPVDQQLLEANWERITRALNRAATELRQTADELERIKLDDHKGERRDPVQIISQAALAIGGRDRTAELVHSLCIWAEAINEIEIHKAGTR